MNKPFPTTLVVLSKNKSTVFVPLPDHYRVPIEGGCECEYCRANPHLVPCWDTLAVPASGEGYAAVVHNPNPYRKP